ARERGRRWGAAVGDPAAPARRQPRGRPADPCAAGDAARVHARDTVRQHADQHHPLLHWRRDRRSARDPAVRLDAAAAVAAAAARPLRRPGPGAPAVCDAAIRTVRLRDDGWSDAYGARREAGGVPHASCAAQAKQRDVACDLLFQRPKNRLSTPCSRLTAHSPMRVCCDHWLSSVSWPLASSTPMHTSSSPLNRLVVWRYSVVKPTLTSKPRPRMIFQKREPLPSRLKNVAITISGMPRPSA